MIFMQQRPKPTALKGSSKSGSVYAFLRNAILDGELAPGAALRLPALTAEYGFGLTPLREALSRLQSDYLVTATHNKGFKVADVSLAELSDLEQTRAIVDVTMLLESIDRGDDAWEGQLVAAHHQLSKIPLPAIDEDMSMLAPWETRHDAFHAALTSACQSVWLHRLSSQISAQLKRYYRFINASVRLEAARRPELRADVSAILANVMGLQHHTSLMQAALDRNGRRAEALMREHVTLATQAYLKLATFLQNKSAA